MIRSSLPIPAGFDVGHKVVVLEYFALFPDCFWNRQRDKPPDVTAQAFLLDDEAALQCLKNAADLKDDEIHEDFFLRGVTGPPKLLQWI